MPKPNLKVIESYPDPTKRISLQFVESELDLYDWLTERAERHSKKGFSVNAQIKKLLSFCKVLEEIGGTKFTEIQTIHKMMEDLAWQEKRVKRLENMVETFTALFKELKRQSLQEYADRQYGKVWNPKTEEWE